MLSTVEYKERLKKYLDSGLTFATARERAAGLEDGLLCGANNNLAIEYIAAARAINADMKFLTVRRLGRRARCRNSRKRLCRGVASARKNAGGGY